MPSKVSLAKSSISRARKVLETSRKKAVIGKQSVTEKQESENAPGKTKKATPKITFKKKYPTSSPLYNSKKSDALKILEKALQNLKDEFVNSDIPTTSISKIQHLIDHKRHSDIKLTNRTFRVTIDGKSEPYTGLTHRLHDLFYPNTEEDPFKRNKEDMKRRRVRGAFLKKVCGTSGSQHGSKVHDQIRKFTASFIKRKTKIKLPARLDQCTIRILMAFVKEKWIPVISERAIFNEDWGVATAIDLVVYEMKSRSLTLIELKTGYENEVYGELSSDDRMKSPLNTVVNCPLNRHLLQVMAMLLMIRNKYGMCMDRAKILRSCARSRKVVLIGLPEWFFYESVQRNLDASLTLNNKHR